MYTMYNSELYPIDESNFYETYSSKYEKLPNVVIHVCYNITEKMNMLKMRGPQIRLCLFTFRPIALKHLNSLTTIDTFSCSLVQR